MISGPKDRWAHRERVQTKKAPAQCRGHFRSYCFDLLVRTVALVIRRPLRLGRRRRWVRRRHWTSRFGPRLGAGFRPGLGPWLWPGLLTRRLDPRRRLLRPLFAYRGRLTLGLLRRLPLWWWFHARRRSTLRLRRFRLRGRSALLRGRLYPGRRLPFRLRRLYPRRRSPLRLRRRLHPGRRSPFRLWRLYPRSPLRHGLGFACTRTGPRLAAAFRPHRPGCALNRRWRRPESH